MNSTYIGKSKLLTLKLIHFLIAVALFVAAWFYFRYGGRPNYHETGFRYNYFVVIGYSFFLLVFSRIYNVYLLGYKRIRALVFGQFISQTFTIIGIYAGLLIAWNRYYSPLPFIPMLIAQAVLDILWSYFANRYYFRINPPKKTVLVYRNAIDKKRFGYLHGKPIERLYKITNEIQYDGSFTELRPLIEGFDAVFVAGVNSGCRNGILKYCQEYGVPGLFLPHIGDVIMQQAVHIQSFDSPVLFIDRKTLDPEYAIAKRAFDLIASLIGLIVLSPVLLIFAIAIRLYDRGPAIYRQVRLTKDGKEFTMYKFRSMRTDAENDGVARLSSGFVDDRITPVGKVMRRFRIDELPQFFNILKGDMSFVGPRPERPEIAEKYYKNIPDFKLRLQVRAGLTGYAQVYGKYNTDPYEKLEFDLLYIGNMSILTDLSLMFATFSVLFSSDSTEGIDSCSETAMDYDFDENAEQSR